MVNPAEVSLFSTVLRLSICWSEIAGKYKDIVHVIYDVTAGLVSQHGLQSSHKTSHRITKAIGNSFVLVDLPLKFKGCMLPRCLGKRNLQEGTA